MENTRSADQLVVDQISSKVGLIIVITAEVIAYVIQAHSSERIIGIAFDCMQNESCLLDSCVLRKIEAVKLHVHSVAGIQISVSRIVCVFCLTEFIGSLAVDVEHTTRSASVCENLEVIGLTADQICRNREVVSKAIAVVIGCNSIAVFIVKLAHGIHIAAGIKGIIANRIPGISGISVRNIFIPDKITCIFDASDNSLAVRKFDRIIPSIVMNVREIKFHARIIAIADQMLNDSDAM